MIKTGSSSRFYYTRQLPLIDSATTLPIVKRRDEEHETTSLIPLHLHLARSTFVVSVTSNNMDAYSPTNDIAVNCSSPSNSSVSDRTWIGDAVRATLQVMKLAPLSLQVQTVHLPPSTVAYHTTLLVSPALNSHFFPLNYLNFRRADSFFSVKATATSRLNFSTSPFSNYNNSMSFHKEFCLIVGCPFSSGLDVRPLAKTGNRLQPDH
ncbi:hypothetical protein NL676_005282 [Syzygium grande]|nr:hypothetical protein NL676_005282 [Syzygium grande]